LNRRSTAYADTAYADTATTPTDADHELRTCRNREPKRSEYQHQAREYG